MPLKYVSINAAHSVCQPGLPLPNGESYLIPTLVSFHKAKSALFFLIILLSSNSKFSSF